MSLLTKTWLELSRQTRRGVERLRQVAPERLLLVALVLLAVGLWAWIARVWPRPLEVTALSVGDGDALLIRTPSGKAVLIDAGSRFATDVGERVIVPNLMLAGVRQLDAVMISHPDEDHVNGLPGVLDALPVKMLLDPEIPSDGTEYQKVLHLARRKEIPCYRARAGGTVDLGDGVALHLLAPGPTLLAATTPGGVTNNNSIVCLLTYRRARMLFTGDLELDGERALLDAHADLRADVLKVAHHGSQWGTSDAFLDAVRPYHAVISCRGGTSSVHPHPAVLQRLRAHGVQILRTDVSGEIHLTTYGEGWRILTYRKPGNGE